MAKIVYPEGQTPMRMGPKKIGDTPLHGSEEYTLSGSGMLCAIQREYQFQLGGMPCQGRAASADSRLRNLLQEKCLSFNGGGAFRIYF